MVDIVETTTDMMLQASDDTSELVSSLMLWAQSTTKDYIRANKAEHSEELVS